MPLFSEIYKTTAKSKNCPLWLYHCVIYRLASYWSGIHVPLPLNACVDTSLDVGIVILQDSSDIHVHISDLFLSIQLLFIHCTCGIDITFGEKLFNRDCGCTCRTGIGVCMCKKS